ncbi:unnamed protein product [Sphagnum jensenii]|uniref:VLIG-type G domain-containing protein n=1 Tax=Sphagnum jensenii TaxID=128206 RepID=A0ABP1BSX7_9BRYO
MSRLAIKEPRFQDLATPLLSPQTAKEILLKVWIEASGGDISKRISGWDPKVLLFELPDFQKLLLHIAQSTEREMDEGKSLVRRIISNDVKVSLVRAGVSLQEPVKAVLQANVVEDEVQDEVQDVATQLPIQRFEPAQLPVHVKNLVANVDPTSAKLTTDGASLDTSLVSVKAWLRQDTNGVVRKIIMKYGFDENGDCNVEGVTNEQVKNMTQEVTVALEVDQFKFPSTPPKDIGAATQSSAVAPYHTPSQFAYAYNGDVLVDRPLDSSENPHRRMLDCLRHRMEPFESSVLNKSTLSNIDDDFDSYFDEGPGDHFNIEDAANDCSQVTTSAFEILVQLLTSSDLFAQVALFQLLLEQRFSVPLVVPYVNTFHKSQRPKGQQVINGFSHLAQALDYVQVRLANQEILSIAEDTNLPRIVFVSNRTVPSCRETPHMASEVLSCQFVSKHSKDDLREGPTVEIGVGFLAAPSDQLRKNRPCLVLCVWGHHSQLGEFLNKVADVVIVETEQLDHEKTSFNLPWVAGNSNIDVVRWNIDSKGKGHKIINKERKHVHMWGSFKDLTEHIAKYLGKVITSNRFKGSYGGATTLEECLIQIRPWSQGTFIPYRLDLGATKFEGVKESLLLQKSFNREADNYFQSLRLRGQQVEFKRRTSGIQQEKKHRESIAKEINNLPIIGLFIQLLKEGHEVNRKIGIVDLQLTINKELHFTLENAAKKVDLAFEASQQNPEDSELKRNYHFAKQEHVDQMLSLEHLWRELSHIFAANPSQKELPGLAARHLLDGFPLEILDGDAAMFHKLWVETVLVELERMLLALLKRKPKVFVLSIVGLQSSGKSTLLNLMFGTQLKTSAGQCTRGVYLQLVKSEWPEFDYVLILDTEGIRAPEFFGTKDVELHDNRLATFAVLPADACIIMVANEEDSGFKEVLPMVLLAFKGSAMAEKHAGRMQAKLFFVYRSVDTNNTKALVNNQRKLQNDLRDASLEISNTTIYGKVEGSSQVPGSHSINSLNNFKVDVQEERSDVKYFGNLKKGNVPPLDTPDWDYGTKVVELRKYIHERVLDGGRWQSHGLPEWTEYLTMVWECIANANFELGFLNHIQYSNYLDLQTELNACRQTVGRLWLREFEVLEGRLQVDKGLDQTMESLWNILFFNVKETIEEEADKVEKILEEKKWQTWKCKESALWSEFCLDQERHWKSRLQDCIDGVLKFDNVVQTYNKEIQVAIESKVLGYPLARNKSQNLKMKKDFSELFDCILQKAENDHPALEKEVHGKVEKVYQNSLPGQEHDLTGIYQDNQVVEEKSLSIVQGVQKVIRTFKWQSHDIHEEEQRIMQQIVTKVESCLKDSKQYAEHLILEVIQYTTKLVEGKKKSLQKNMHLYAKGKLTPKLEAIQHEWDKQHNVAERLKTNKNRLWQFFQNCANRVGGTQMLCDEVLNLLKEHMPTSFQILLSKNISDKLQNKSWVLNWKVMKAYLDLDLVTLIENKNMNELLKYIRDGKLHYQNCVDMLIQKEIDKEAAVDNLWKLFVKSIQDAFKFASITAEYNSQLNFTSFVDELTKQLLEKANSPELARNIQLVNDGVYSKYEKVIGFETVEKEICATISNMQHNVTSLIQKKLIDLVKTRMISSATECARPRCEEMCPCCKFTCIDSAKHSTKHETLHQPTGLVGTVWITDQTLIANSCTQSVMDGSMFNVKFFGIQSVHEFLPYKDFEIYFPRWKLPTEGLGESKVREYIFAHYHQELVEKYSDDTFKVKICNNIPLEFSRHDIKDLRCELENVIRLHES